MTKYRFKVDWINLFSTIFAVYIIMVICTIVMRIIIAFRRVPRTISEDGILSLGYQPDVWDVFPHAGIWFTRVIGWSVVGIIGLVIGIMCIIGLVYLLYGIYLWVLTTFFEEVETNSEVEKIGN